MYLRQVVYSGVKVRNSGADLEAVSTL